MSEEKKSNLLAYVAKTEGAKAAEVLISTVGAAGDQWKALGTSLTIAFQGAYKLHEKGLKDVEARFKTEDSNLMYYLLAAFIAGAVGGGIGLLLTPALPAVGMTIATSITTSIGSRFAQAGFTKTAVEIMVKGGEEVGVKATEKLEIDKFLSTNKKDNGGEDNSMFTPPETDPHKFDLLKRHEVDVCVSELKEYIKRFQMAADKFRWGVGSARAFQDLVMDEDFMKKQPNTDEIRKAAGKEKQDQAETGMWVAWAKGRKIHYWKERLLGVRELDRGAEYNDYIELRKFDPIIERLKALKVDHLTTMAFTVTDPAFKHLVRQKAPLLNIPALAKLGSITGDPFLKRIDSVVNKRLSLKDFIKSY